MTFKGMFFTVIFCCSMGAFAADEIAETAVESESKLDNNIRITIGNAPGIDEVEDSTGSESVSEDGGSRVEVVYIRRFWSKTNPNVGGSFGGGLFFGEHGLSDSGIQVDLTTYGLFLQGGFLAQAGDYVVIELGPYLGIGVADNKTTGYLDEGRGTYGLFGLKAGAFLQLGKNFELGLELGYEGFSHEQEYAGGWVGYETVTFSGSGGHVAAVLAAKF